MHVENDKSCSLNEQIDEEGRRGDENATDDDH